MGGGWWEDAWAGGSHTSPLQSLSETSSGPGAVRRAPRTSPEHLVQPGLCLGAVLWASGLWAGTYFLGDSYEGHKHVKN